MPSDAIALLKTAAALHPRGLAGVAGELRYSRPALSRYVNGDYPGAVKLEAAIYDRYQGMRACPHDGDEVPIAHCRKRAHAPEPFGGNARHAAWQACQVCPFKPLPEAKP